MVFSSEVRRLKRFRLCILISTGLLSRRDLEKIRQRQSFVWQKAEKGLWRCHDFSDEKWFIIEQAHNHQNDRVWSNGKPPREERMTSRRHKRKQVMVWVEVTHTGKTPPHSVPEGVKVQVSQYRALMESKPLPWTRQHFGEQVWTLQQDDAPSRKFRTN